MSTSNVAAPSSRLVQAVEQILDRRQNMAEELARRARALATTRLRRTWKETKRELLGHLEHW